MSDGLIVNLISNLEDLVRKLPEVVAPTKAAADKIATVARDTAPVESGDYKAGIVTQKTQSGYRVVASDPKSAWVEFGVPSHHQPPQFILRRAVESAGYKFKKN
jgi:hypothetical protein